MVENLILVPRAEWDVAQGYAWYQERQPGLGEEFLRSVDACLLSIRRNPEMHEFAHESYRRALLRRFPYAVFYEFVGNAVTVYSVFHCSQDPKKWRERLP